MKPFLGLSVLLLLAQDGVRPPTLEVRPSTSNISIGERFQVTVEAHGASGMSYEFPKEISTGAVEMTLSRSATALASVAVYDAQVFALGAEARIPEVELHYKASDGVVGTVKSKPVPLNAVSTIDPKEENPAPADFAPPMKVLVSRAFWVAGTIAGIMLVSSLVLLVRRLRLPKKLVDPTVTPAISPEEEALNGLGKLATSSSSLEPKAFYIQLIQILKLYLERRLGAPVLEMTSTETLAFVKSQPWTAPHAVALRELVTSADLVKFGGSSDATKANQQIQLVRDLVGRIDRLRRTELEMESRQGEGRRTA